MDIKKGTSVVINLASRYAAAFGLAQVDKFILNAVVTNEKNKYNIDYFSDFDPETEKIRLVYDHIVMEFGSMMSFNQEGIIQETAIFAPPVMIEFRRGKEIIETKTNGEDNVIIERWSTKPWEISIRGILVDMENHHYPSEQIRKLHHLFKINNVLEVYGNQFEEKDIDHIYLKDISITPVQGFSDTINFTLSASSIKSVSWNLLKPNDS